MQLTLKMWYHILLSPLLYHRLIDDEWGDVTFSPMDAALSMQEASLNKKLPKVQGASRSLGPALAEHGKSEYAATVPASAILLKEKKASPSSLTVSIVAETPMESGEKQLN